MGGGTVSSNVVNPGINFGFCAERRAAPQSNLSRPDRSRAACVQIEVMQEVSYQDVDADW